MIDVDLVTRKLLLITTDLEALEPLARKSREAYLASGVDEVLAERYLERVIGRMIDINYHVLTESGQPPPPDYYQSFVALGPLGCSTPRSRGGSRRAPAFATASSTSTTRSIL